MPQGVKVQVLSSVPILISPPKHIKSAFLSAFLYFSTIDSLIMLERIIALKNEGYYLLQKINLLKRAAPTVMNIELTGSSCTFTRDGLATHKTRLITPAGDGLH